MKTSDLLFKAGARLVRSGGSRSERPVLAWCDNNRLTARQRAHVLEGFRTERIQIQLRGGLLASVGRPYGRL